MAKIREVFSSGGLRTRDEAIHEVSSALGYVRLGVRIRECLDAYIRTAVRRGIVDPTPGGLRLLCRSITEYERDFLVEQLLAGMGTTWWTREDLIYGTARWLGFRRTGRLVRDALKSAINGAIRRGLLERDGPDRIRRVR